MLKRFLALIPGTRAYRLHELRRFHYRVQIRRELYHLERVAYRMPYGPERRRLLTEITIRRIGA